MLRINELKIQVSHSEEELKNKIAKLLRTKRDFDFKVVRRALDARHKPDLYFNYIVDISIKGEEEVLKHADKKVTKASVTEYKFPCYTTNISEVNRPIIIGLGPAGLFAGLYLARNGYRPIIFERGQCIEQRSKTVEEFFRSGKLNVSSNIQFGEGGAGAFSDGKLNTLVKDKSGRNKVVLKDLVNYGAPEEILYDYKPHVGTDILLTVVKNISDEIRRLGGEIYYDTNINEFRVENGELVGIGSSQSEVKHEGHPVILAIGHSSRDTFEILNSVGIYMKPKPFAVGFRVQHPVELINENQYGKKVIKELGNATYKVTHQCKDGRGVYSFCMCPGGFVVNASSEDGRLAVNGMSYSKRDSKCSNSAIIVTINPEDYGDGQDPMSGIKFQRKLEEKAYRLGNGNIPYELYCEFKEARINDGVDPLLLTKGDCKHAAVHEIMPQFINDDFVEGMEAFGKQISGFDNDETVVYGVESRTSSPVKMYRSDTCESNIKNLYVCGEGAGYAGGITSAAMDGILVAQNVAMRINESENVYEY